MATEVRSTDQLRVGDVVLNSGMRLVIDQPIRTYSGHLIIDPHNKETVYNTSAFIENVEALRAEAENGNNIAQFILAVCDKSVTGERWVIQGNHLATWAVEV
jgi:hypothetical protein